MGTKSQTIDDERIDDVRRDIAYEFDNLDEHPVVGRGC